MTLRLGVLTDSNSHLNLVLNLLNKTEYEVVCTALSPNATAPLRTDLDAWVVSIDEHCDNADKLIAWLEDIEFPTVIADVGRSSEPLTNEYAQRFAMRILDCLAERGDASLSAPRHLWVLAASAGGPEAVCEFLSKLPEKLDSVAFLYVQHIDQKALPPLVQSLKRKSHLRVELCAGNRRVTSGCIYVALPESEFDLTASGNLLDLKRPWKGIYAPSINQAVGKIAARGRFQTGAIFFSGMGNDGVEAVRLLKAKGAPVWSQSSETCVVDSMPSSIRSVVNVDFTGSPGELARHFAAEFAEKPELQKSV